MPISNKWLHLGTVLVCILSKVQGISKLSSAAKFLFSLLQYSCQTPGCLTVLIIL